MTAAHRTTVKSWPDPFLGRRAQSHCLDCRTFTARGSVDSVNAAREKHEAGVK